MQVFSAFYFSLCWSLCLFRYDLTNHASEFTKVPFFNLSCWSVSNVWHFRCGALIYALQWRALCTCCLIHWCWIRDWLAMHSTYCEMVPPLLILLTGQTCRLARQLQRWREPEDGWMGRIQWRRGCRGDINVKWKIGIYNNSSLMRWKGELQEIALVEKTKTTRSFEFKPKVV